MRYKKKDLYEKLGELGPEGGREWHNRKNAQLCKRSGKRMTLQTPFQDMQRIVDEKCEGSSHTSTMGGKQTRDEYLRSHRWNQCLAGHYLRFQTCGALGTHCAKRCNWEEQQKTGQALLQWQLRRS